MIYVYDAKSKKHTTRPPPTWLHQEPRDDARNSGYRTVEPQPSVLVARGGVGVQAVQRMGRGGVALEWQVRQVQ